MIPPLLQELTLVFLAAVPVTFVCKRFGVPVVVGLLLSGVVAGPSVLGLVSDLHAVETIAEIGVVLLLFDIGLELSGGELARLKRPVLVGGGVQAIATLLLVEALGGLLGITWQKALFFGFLVSLSSTAVVLKTLQERGETASPAGRTVLSVLIMQDILVAPMMLLIPLLSGGSGSVGQALALMLGKAALLLVIVFVIARRMLPKVFHALAASRSREMFFLSVLVLCLGVALLSGKLGLSLSLGAFLAGLILAESDYGLRALQGLVPFKDVFTSLFFISIGMLVDLKFLAGNLPIALGISLGVVLLKLLTGTAASLSLGQSPRTALAVGFSLAQIGEFSFVLSKTGTSAGLMTRDESQLFLAAGVATMILAPFATIHAGEWSRRLVAAVSRLRNRPEPPPAETEAPGEVCGERLVIAGFGVGGERLANAAKLFGVPFTVVDLNPATIRRLKAEGVPAVYGDAGETLILKKAGIGCAKVFAVLTPDPAATRRAVELAKSLNPDVAVVARTRFTSEIEALSALGATEVVAEEFETAVELFARTLERLGAASGEVEAAVTAMKNDHYSAFRGGVAPRPSSLERLGTAISDVDSARFHIAAGAPLDGKSLKDSALRSEHGLTVAAVVRAGRTLVNPPPEFVFAQGDEVHVLGPTGQPGRKGALFCGG